MDSNRISATHTHTRGSTGKPGGARGSATRESATRESATRESAAGEEAVTRPRSISVVIPFLDEERALPATLARLFAAHATFEAIAVDAGSSDASRAILAGYPVRIIDAPRGRAAQMNAGAAEACGELLLFLHADTLLPVGALDSLAARVADEDFQWGGFRQAFSNPDWRLRLVSRLHNLRCQRSGVFYGDQSMFVRRSLFIAVGGFPPVTMEDIAISERLLAECAPTTLDAVVITDSRKFVQMGVWRSLGRVIAILCCRQLHLPLPAAFFANIR